MSAEVAGQTWDKNGEGTVNISTSESIHFKNSNKGCEDK